MTMPQGKLKVKTKLPTAVKAKVNKGKKGPAVKKRASEKAYFIES